MKKLLIIGANPETTPLVQMARDMGIYTIVTDYDSNADAKKIADKAYDVDGMDVDGLVELGKKENVDGVLVGVADLLIAPYQEVCERLGLPCYANKEQVKVFTNKMLFKQKCAEFGIKGVPEYLVHKNMTKGEMENICFPIIIKPVDSCSGKGITLCRDAKDLDEALDKAYSCSKSGIVLAERYMECADVSIYYTIKDGVPYLSSISDRYTCRTQGTGSPVCMGELFPSKYIAEFMDNYNEKFCRMFESMGMNNCVIYISAFYENGEYYVYDPGFRLQGGGFHLILNAANQFDHREMLIKFALGEGFGTEDFERMNDPYLKGQSAAVVWFLLRAGKISAIEGMGLLGQYKEISYIVQRLYAGATVEKSQIGTEGQVFARIFIVAQSKERLKEVIEGVYRAVRVYGDKHENMIADTDVLDYI